MEMLLIQAMPKVFLPKIISQTKLEIREEEEQEEAQEPEEEVDVAEEKPISPPTEPDIENEESYLPKNTFKQPKERECVS